MHDLTVFSLSTSTIVYLQNSHVEDLLCAASADVYTGPGTPGQYAFCQAVEFLCGQEPEAKLIRFTRGLDRLMEIVLRIGGGPPQVLRGRPPREAP